MEGKLKGLYPQAHHLKVRGRIKYTSSMEYNNPPLKGLYIYLVMMVGISNELIN